MVECCAGAFARGCGSVRVSSVIVAVAVALGCSDGESGQKDTGGMGGVLFLGAGTTDGGLTGGNAGATNSDGGNVSGGARGGGGDTSAGGRASGSGSMPSGGATSSGGVTSSGGTAAGGVGGSAATGQPIGAICANDANCSQTQGMAVCCATPACAGPCECRLAANCPKSGLFLECKGAADCSGFGGGKVCCQVASGSQTMQYCTKPSGCPGTVLP